MLRLAAVLVAVLLAGCGEGDKSGAGGRNDPPKDGDRVSYEGRIVPNVECLALKLKDGGKLGIGSLRPGGLRFHGQTFLLGDRVRVTGTYYNVSPCGSGVRPRRVVRIGAP
jgi:hypothetical protein